MNYDLAIMALEGIGRSPIEVSVAGGEVTITAAAATFKDLARLCLLLGGDMTGGAEGFDLEPGLHVAKNAPTLKLRLK
ncbi:MAG: hypothetical protein ACXW3E_14020 [Thermoanaerobaculia bacterium]